jgi:translation initiation factor IF-2
VDLKKETVPEVVEKPPMAERPEPRRPAAAAAKQVGGPIVGGEPLPGEEEARKKRKKKPRERADEKVEEDKSKVRRRKEVLLRHDLYDDRPRHGRLRTKGRKPKQRKTEITTPKASKRRVKLPEVITVADLAHKMSVKSAEVIQHLLSLGVTATMNEGIDFETAMLVASEFGFEAESSEHSEKDLLPSIVKDAEENLQARPPSSRSWGMLITERRPYSISYAQAMSRTRNPVESHSISARTR